MILFRNAECGRTLFDGHESGVEGGHEAGLRKGVLQGEEFVLGDGVGTGLEDGFRTDGTQVRPVSVPQRQLAAVVFGGEQAVFVAGFHQFTCKGRKLIAISVRVLLGAAS